MATSCFSTTNSSHDKKSHPIPPKGTIQLMLAILIQRIVEISIESCMHVRIVYRASKFSKAPEKDSYDYAILN